MNDEERVRLAVFDYLAALVERHPDAIPRSELEAGAPLGHERVRLIGPQGIFKPRQLSVPLSITTAPPQRGREPPYPDAVEGDLLQYSYRGTDPQHPDNVGLRTAMRERVALVYFFGIEPGWYFATWPVFVVGDAPSALAFTVALDASAAPASHMADVASELRKAYSVRPVRQRLHQAAFRVRVLRAYQSRCAMCRLRHVELLDAAHILPDTDPRSTTSTSNGLSLCKLHHAAFDRHLIGVRPDLGIEVREDILAETDGPMLRHGLQGLHRAPLEVPRRRLDRPQRDFLEQRYELFRRAG